MSIEIDNASEASRRATAQILDLALSRPAGKATYAAALEGVLLPILNEPDVHARAQAVADLVDGAVTAVFTLLVCASTQTENELADVALVVERTIQSVTNGP